MGVVYKESQVFFPTGFLFIYCDIVLFVYIMMLQFNKSSSGFNQGRVEKKKKTEPRSGIHVVQELGKLVDVAVRIWNSGHMN